MRNVILICLDAVRKDIFQEFAQRLRERATIEYQQTRAASCWSVPSHASMFTGVLPSEHGVHAHNLDYTPIHGETFLSSHPRFRTVGVSSNGYANSTFSFDSLFDEFKDVPFDPFEIAGVAIEDMLFDGTPVPHFRDNGTKRAIRQFESMLTEGDEPVFGFVNLMEAHTPHRHVHGYDRECHSVPNRWTSNRVPREEVVRNVDKHSEYLDCYRELYRASVEYLDRHVSAFVDTLLDELSNPTTVVVTADHGENLGYNSEERFFGHTTSVSEGVLHVPLIIINPPNERIPPTDQYVSHLALPRLLTGLAKGRIPDVSSEKIPAEVVGQAISFKSNATYWDRMIRCVYTKESKVVWDSLDQSFTYSLDSNRDSWEERHASDPIIPDSHTALFGTEIAEFKRQAALSQAQTNEHLDSLVTDRLEHLGYRS